MSVQRLGSWQLAVLADTRKHGVVAFSAVRPRGKAANYSARYQQSFRSLGAVPGYQIGAFGPRGGLALQYTGA